MRHLIIGAGKMGKRHAAILEGMGDICEMVDIEFKMDGFNFHGFDSALICTPPETHAEYIRQSAKMAIPLFVEKPVQVSAGLLDYPGISMVACNWRWCRCVDWLKDNHISCQYKSIGILDLIHFVDVFWTLHGRPQWSTMKTAKGFYSISLGNADFSLTADILHSDTKTFAGNVSEGNYRTIHETMCPMFNGQMFAWREVIRGGISPNPITIASERTNWLIETIASQAKLQLPELQLNKSGV